MEAKTPVQWNGSGSSESITQPETRNDQNAERRGGESSDILSGKTVRVRLPKLEIRKFDGKIEHWQEFWDCFKSSVDQNDGLSEVDKFSYLRGLLQDQARASISGLALTSANYKSAKELLRQRYGRDDVIQRTHIKELLKIPHVFSDRDPARLHALYDAVETHHRGLQALGVSQESYSSIVVPAMIDKLPEAIRLSITRGKQHSEWKMDEMLKELLSEVELREEHWTPRDKPPRDSQGNNLEPRLP